MVGKEHSPCENFGKGNTIIRIMKNYNLGLGIWGVIDCKLGGYQMEHYIHQTVMEQGLDD